jgi:FkbM family methyltransferase
MNAIETGARWLKYKLGFEDSSKMVCLARPAYNSFLQMLYGKRGIVRVLNGREKVRLRPRYRLIRDYYESKLCQSLEQIVHTGDVVLEVGANVGVFTILLARWVGRTGHVYALEPNPHARAALEDHLRLNMVADRVSVIPAAISSESGRSTFYVQGSSGEGTLSSGHSRLSKAEGIDVEVTTIDEFCSARRITPALIKIDIEGFELHALRGSLQQLSRQRPILAVEMHPAHWPEIGVTAGDIVELISAASYHVHPLQGQADPFSSYGHAILDPLPLPAHGADA